CLHCVTMLAAARVTDAKLRMSTSECAPAHLAVLAPRQVQYYHRQIFVACTSCDLCGRGRCSAMIAARQDQRGAHARQRERSLFPWSLVSTMRQAGRAPMP